jgi:hypothetical protein
MYSEQSKNEGESKPAEETKEDPKSQEPTADEPKEEK